MCLILTNRFAQTWSCGAEKKTHSQGEIFNGRLTTLMISVLNIVNNDPSSAHINVAVPK